MDSDTTDVERIITEDTEETADPQETVQEQLETVAEVQENTAEGATSDSAELDESESFTKGPQVSTDHLNSEDDPDNEQTNTAPSEHAHILNSTENNVTSENTDASLSNASKKRKRKRKKKKKATETSQQEISEPSQPEESVNKNKENR